MMTPRFELPPPGTLTPNGDSDPLRFYYLPLVGRVFVSRLQTGLDLLDGRFRRLLEVGYGSGLLMPTLARISDELYGADLEVEPPSLRATLERLGTHPHELVKADIRALPFSDGFFDGVIAFSILEHLKHADLEQAARELARVISVGGRLLIGCPAVHPVMNAAFAVIGFPNIGQHHFSGPPAIIEAMGRHFTVEKRSTLPRLGQLLPVGWAPYTALLFRRT